MKNIEDNAQITIPYNGYLQLKKIVESIETKEGIISHESFGGMVKYYWFNEKDKFIKDLIKERDELRDKVRELEKQKTR